MKIYTSRIAHLLGLRCTSCIPSLSRFQTTSLFLEFFNSCKSNCQNHNFFSNQPPTRFCHSIRNAWPNLSFSFKHPLLYQYHSLQYFQSYLRSIPEPLVYDITTKRYIASKSDQCQIQAELEKSSNIEIPTPADTNTTVSQQELATSANSSRFGLDQTHPLKDETFEISKYSNGSQLQRWTSSVPGQVLYPATPEAIEILAASKRKFAHPHDTESGVIIRLIKLSDPVTSPVSRTIRNSQYGIRGNEKYNILLYGFTAVTCLTMLAYWQLRRMHWKENLIELRRERLAMPRINISNGPFPWSDKVGEYAYRTVEVRGVFDVKRQMKIGPRPGLVPGTVGFGIVYPMTLQDGSTVLVNRGHCPIEFCQADTLNEVPEWVTIRAVIEPGEIPNTMVKWKKLKNNVEDRQFIYMDPADLGSIAGAKNVEECKQVILSAYDVLYDDDVAKSLSQIPLEGADQSAQQVLNRRRRWSAYQMRQRPDYLIFWADENTHFNYACQWLLMAATCLGMTLFKFWEVSRWKF